MLRRADAGEGAVPDRFGIIIDGGFLAMHRFQAAG
jgi:hypothetical protein